MRLLVIAQSFWPSLGGAEIMLRRLCQEWARQGHDVWVWTTRPDHRLAASQALDGFHIARHRFLSFRWLGTLAYMGSLRIALRREHRAFDAVYVSMLKHPAYATLGALRHSSIPIVLRAEGAGKTGDVAWHDCVPFGRRIRERCRQANAIVAPSPAIQTELLAAGFAPDRLRLIPNGVPIPEVPWGRAATSTQRRQLGLPDRPTLVFAGRLAPEKNLVLLLEALAELRRRKHDVQLAILGEGPERAALQARIDALHLGDRVRFAGLVAEVEPYLRAADVLLLPSLHEGLSVALLEALAIGMPALASDILANAQLAPLELLPRLPTGQPAAWADAIEAHVAIGGADPWSAAKLSATRRLIAGHYSLSAIASRHIELFEQLAITESSHPAAKGR